ncbi:MAG: PE-PPE domain-containing protein [Mycobacterium sp.]
MSEFVPRSRVPGVIAGPKREKPPYEWLAPLTAATLSLSLVVPVTAHASTLISIGATGSWTNAPVTALQQWPARNNFVDDPVTRTEVVQYPASLGFIGMPMEESVAEGAAALFQAISSISGRKVVACESQGCLAVTRLLMQFEANPTTAPATGDLIIVMIGNPATADGGLSAQKPGGYEPFFRITFPGATPETGYETVNVTREYDFFADRPQNDPNALAIWNNLVSFLVVHPFYADVDMDDPTNLVKVVGNTTYVLVPTKQLPMLKSLYDAAQAWQRLTGQANLLQEVEALDARLRAIIDQDYDRSGYVAKGGLDQGPAGGTEPEPPPAMPAPDSPDSDDNPIGTAQDFPAVAEDGADGGESNDAEANGAESTEAKLTDAEAISEVAAEADSAAIEQEAEQPTNLAGDSSDRAEEDPHPPPSTTSSDTPSSDSGAESDAESKDDGGVSA